MKKTIQILGLVIAFGNLNAQTYFSDDFDPEPGTLTQNNAWTTQVVVPSTSSFDWNHDGYMGDGYARISNWNGSGNEALESWLITPAIDYASSTSTKFNFRMTKRYGGDDIVVYISTDYDGSSAPSTANWTDITSLVTLDSDDSQWTFVGSGDADITAYKSASTYIAFKYTGSSTSGRTWEIDNVYVGENAGSGTVAIEEQNESNIQIFPNPSTGIINVLNTNNVNIEIYNTLGELVKMTTDNQINLTTGFYIIKIGSYTKSIIIE